MQLADQFRFALGQAAGLGEILDTRAQGHQPRGLDVGNHRRVTLLQLAEPLGKRRGKLLLLEDNHLNLWSIDLATGTPAKLDTGTYDDPGRRFDQAWSPDSRWVAYSKSLNSHLRAIFVYSVADRISHQITDGLSDAVSPVFDASGKYLYFLASTNYALRTGWLEMSSMDRPVTRAIYLAVLSASALRPRASASSWLPAAVKQTVR